MTHKNPPKYYRIVMRYYTRRRSHLKSGGENDCINQMALGQYT